jgi:hypothetical protein
LHRPNLLFPHHEPVANHLDGELDIVGLNQPLS